MLTSFIASAIKLHLRMKESQVHVYRGELGRGREGKGIGTYYIGRGGRRERHGCIRWGGRIHRPVLLWHA